MQEIKNQLVKNPRITKSQRVMFRMILDGVRLCSTRDPGHRWAWFIFKDDGISNAHTGTFQAMVRRKFIVPFEDDSSREYCWTINPEVINTAQLKKYDAKLGMN